MNPSVTRHRVGLFEYCKNDPDKARRFSKAMAGLRKMDCHLDYLLKEGFNWSAVKDPSFTVEVRACVSESIPR